MQTVCLNMDAQALEVGKMYDLKGEQNMKTRCNLNAILMQSRYVMAYRGFPILGGRVVGDTEDEG